MAPRVALSSALILFATHCIALGAPLAIVQLDKQYVPFKKNGQVVAHKTAYFGSIFVGFPKQQRFTVVFDTGSGHLFVPSMACATPTCLRHRRYNRSESKTAIDIDHSGETIKRNAVERDQVSISFGTGDVLGDFVQDFVCLSEQPNENLASSENGKDCIKMRVITATEMTEEPFLDFDFDGVVGLGLGALAVDPGFSYFGELARQNVLPEARFGFFLGRSDDIPSEIAFGGHDERRVSEPLKWAKVMRPELGHWQVQIKSLKIGGVALPMCETGKCVGIVDSGTSLLGVPKPHMKDIHMKLIRRVSGDPEKLDCRDVAGPELVFDLGGLEISLGPEDYSRPAAMRVTSKSKEVQVVCRATLLNIDMPADDGGSPLTFILGEPILRKYYTSFDWKKQEIGFALAKQPTPGESIGVVGIAATTAAAHTVKGAPISAPAPVNIQVSSPTPVTIQV